MNGREVIVKKMALYFNFPNTIKKIKVKDSCKMRFLYSGAPLNKIGVFDNVALQNAASLTDLVTAPY